jgi:hypothetical protein
MTIAVSLFRKDDKFYTQLLYGRPTKIVNRDNGKIALVSENELFLYETVVRKTNVYLFRGVGDISIPFVSPGVNLISHGNNIMQKNKLIKKESQVFHEVGWRAYSRRDNRCFFP